MKLSGTLRGLRAVLLALSFAVIFMVPVRQALGEDATRPIPKAACGPRDRTESVQGQTTLAERFNPGSAKAYNCNLELVGQFDGEGSSFGMNAFDDCAYVATWPNPQLKRPGVPVLDVSDSRHPKVTTYLDSPAMLSANESLVVENTRKLLIANKLASTIFDIYDLSSDCRHPVLKSSTSIPRMQSHAGEFSPDGRTFFSASCCSGVAEATAAPGPTAPPASAVFAIDVSDPTHPFGIATWVPENKDWLTHAVSVDKSGTRAYVSLARQKDDQFKAPNPNGLVVLDVSDIQARRPNPQFRIVSTLFWDDTHFSQYGMPVTIKGRPYLIWTDNTGSIGTASNPPSADACDSGKPGFGFARIIDLGDEKRPRTLSKLMLEVHDPANCSKAMHDPTVGFQYGSTACDVDDAADAKLLACGYFEGGLRVFDIRVPSHPREIAYYKPPARRTESRPGAPPHFPFLPASAMDHTADQVIYPKFRKNGQEIWFNSFDNGFQVVRFTDHVKASEKDLFKK